MIQVKNMKVVFLIALDPEQQIPKTLTSMPTMYKSAPIVRNDVAGGVHQRHGVVNPIERYVEL